MYQVTTRTPQQKIKNYKATEKSRLLKHSSASPSGKMSCSYVCDPILKMDVPLLRKELVKT